MATHSSILAWEIPWTQEIGDYSPWGHEELNTTEQLSTTQQGIFSTTRTLTSTGTLLAPRPTTEAREPYLEREVQGALAQQSSSAHGILQARILEWVAMPPRDPTCISYVSCLGKWVLYH